MNKKICPVCNCEFDPGRKDKKYCEKKCYFASKINMIDIECEWCKITLSVPIRLKDKKYCSKACSNSGTKRLKRIIKECITCQKQFNVIESVYEKKYCTYDCFILGRYGKTTDKIEKTCEECKNIFFVKFIRRYKRFCSRSCATKGERNGAYGKPGWMTGKTPWLKGLSVKTDIRVKLMGEKISENLKESFNTGKRNHIGKNNPMFGRTADTMTEENIKRYSEAAIKRVQDGVSGYKTGHLTGIYESEKCKNPIKFKSSWELAAMMSWDDDENIVGYEYEKNTYLLDNGKSAIPDFEVFIKDGTSKTYEIKPTAILNIPNVMEKILLVKKAVNDAGKDYVLLGNSEIGQFISELGEDFKNAVNMYKDRIEKV